MTTILPNITILDADPKISRVGYTDFERVWLSPDLAGQDRDIAMIHECSHIWLGHRGRSKAAQKAHGAAFDPHTWNVALDCEIAQHVYTKEQTAHIANHQGLLKGGIVWPMDGASGEFAEEIYASIMAMTPENRPCERSKHLPPPQGAPADQDALGAPADPNALSGPGAAQDAGPDAAGPDAPMTKTELRQAIKQIEERFGERLTKPVTRKSKLSSDIAALARTAERRIRSTSVASRRQLDKTLVLPGYRAAKFAPKVEIFVDRSGSFDQAKTQASLAQVEKLIAKYGAKIKREIFYFGDGKLRKDDPRVGYGDTPYHLIYNHLKLSQPALAVVITDDDHCASAPAIPVPVRVLCVGSTSSCVSEAWPMAKDSEI